MPYSRAYAQVYLEDPASGLKAGPELCLVDTGADYTILPDTLAVTLGLVMGQLPVVSIAVECKAAD
jgi:predicted aspartyl protease